MPAQSAETSSLRDLTASPAIQAAIDAVLAELEQVQASITAVRGPDPARASDLRDALVRAKALRGRSSFYPYLGSGLGNGPLVQLADGSVKWDMINGIGVHMFGHGDADLLATALRAALTDTVMQGNLQFNAEVVDFADLLVRTAGLGSGIAHCFLINSGALANESALKVCLQHNAPASRVLAFEGCFAGRTTAMAQIGDSAAGRVGIPLDLAVDYVPFYNANRPKESTLEAQRRLGKLVKRYPGEHACFVMELVQGEGGFNTAPREFFVPLMELCRASSIGVWIDEVQTIGRLPSPFAFQMLELGEWVDVVTVGKLTQVCACLYTEDYNPKPGLLSATFVGSTVALAVGHRMVTRLLEGDYFGPTGRNARLQAAFREQAQALVARHPDWFPEIRYPDGHTSDSYYDGVGGMMRFTPFGGARDRITEALHALFEEGVIAFSCGRDPFHIRMLPPVGVMEPGRFADVFALVESALARIGRER
jgi:acetylornithine aminotransferase